MCGLTASGCLHYNKVSVYSAPWFLSALSSSATPRWGSFLFMNMKKVRITCIQNKNFKYRPAPLQPPIPWNRLQGGYVYTHKKTDYSITPHHAISFLSSHNIYTSHHMISHTHHNHITSYHITSRHTIPYLSCHVIAHGSTSYHIMSYHAMT